MRLAASNTAIRHVVQNNSFRRSLTTQLGGSPNYGLFIPYEPSNAVHPNPNAENIAILGGGITGLTAAYHLAQTLPKAKIKIFEKSKRLGGWIESERVQVNGGDVLFEWGPRSLRPDLDGAGLATAQLISNLWLNSDVFGIRKRSSAARNRFIYYPDRLTRMPSPYGNFFSIIFDVFRTVFSEPIFKGVPSSMFAEPLMKQRPQGLQDESVGDFLRRRFGVAVADNLASALFHGIYAGDIYKLSARTCLPKLWYLEGRDVEGNSVILEQLDLTLKGRRLASLQDFRFLASNPDEQSIYVGGTVSQLSRIRHLLSRCAMYTLSNGLGMLSVKLSQALESFQNVEVYTSSQLQSLSFTTHQNRSKVLLHTKDKQSPDAFDYVVSSLRPGTMANLIKAGTTRLPLVSFPTEVFSKIDKATTVMVVNLYYDSPTLLPPGLQGFGYLIPRSVALEQNPERALGVIFGSSEPMPRGADVIRPASPFSEKQIQMGKEQMTRFQESVEGLIARQKEIQASAAAYKPTNRLEKQMAAAQGRLLKGCEAELKAQRTMKAEIELLLKLGHEPGKGEPWRIGQDTAPGTKLTVMLGGHWWDGWSKEDLPDEQEGIKMAKSILKRHLNVTDEPAVAKARLQRDCIPQYPVGYRDYMATVHKDVLIDQFKGRLKVAGPWWQGAVGVNDSIRRAKEMAFAIDYGQNDRTGLEDFVGKEKWVLIDTKTGQATIDPMCE